MLIAFLNKIKLLSYGLRLHDVSWKNSWIKYSYMNLHQYIFGSEIRGILTG